MKQPKRLTRSQKELISRRGLDPRNYMYHAEDDVTILLSEKDTGKRFLFWK